MTFEVQTEQSCCLKNWILWLYSSVDVRDLLCCCSRASTSALRARLLAFPWNRPFFPAPFPCRISSTLERRKYSELWRIQVAIGRLSGKATGSYCGPSLATSSLGPARTNKPAPFSSPTVRKTKVSLKSTKTIEQ